MTQYSDGLVHLGHVYILKKLEMSKEGKMVFADGLEKVRSNQMLCSTQLA